MKRRVIGQFLKPNGEPMKGLLGSFSIDSLTHDALSFYSKEPVYFWTDSDGQIVANNPDTLPVGFVQPLGVDLVCTNTLDIPVKYLCVLNRGGDPFFFLLPSGSTTVNLQTLSSATVDPEDEQYTTILQYVDTLVDTAIVGVVAGKNKKLVSETYTANATLPALRILNLPNLQYADCRDTTHINTNKGLTENATTIGIDFNCTITGNIFDSGWNWLTNQPIFLGYHGELIQSIPFNAAFIQQVAIALTPQSIFLSFKEPIQL